jgi:hypothetical protein
VRTRRAGPKARVVSLLVLLGALVSTTGGSTLAQADLGLQQRRAVGNLTAEIWLAPGIFRPTGVEVRLTDPAGQVPADVRRVDVAFAMRGMNHGARGIAAEPTDGGVYQAAGYLLAMSGSWWMALRVERGDGQVQSALFPFEAPSERTGIASLLYTRPIEWLQVEDVAIYPEGVMPDRIDVTVDRPVRLEVMYVDGPACGEAVGMADGSASTVVSAEGLAELAFVPGRTVRLSFTCTPGGLQIAPETS